MKHVKHFLPKAPGPSKTSLLARLHFVNTSRELPSSEATSRDKPCCPVQSCQARLIGDGIRKMTDGHQCGPPYLRRQCPVMNWVTVDVAKSAGVCVSATRWAFNVQLSVIVLGTVVIRSKSWCHVSVSTLLLCCSVNMLVPNNEYQAVSEYQ